MSLSFLTHFLKQVMKLTKLCHLYSYVDLHTCCNRIYLHSKSGYSYHWLLLLPKIKGQMSTGPTLTQTVPTTSIKDKTPNQIPQLQRKWPPSPNPLRCSSSLLKLRVNKLQWSLSKHQLPKKITLDNVQTALKQTTIHDFPPIFIIKYVKQNKIKQNYL